MIINNRREYRVMQFTHGDDSVSFEVQYRTNPHSHWLILCFRDTLELAKIAIEVTKREEVISKEVVYAE